MYKYLILILFFVSFSVVADSSRIRVPAQYAFFMSDPMPRYLLKEIVEKGGIPAVRYAITSSEWIRKNSDLLKKSSPLFIIEHQLSFLEKERFNELAQALNYHLFVLVLPHARQGWKCPPLTACFTVSIKNTDVFMRKGTGKTMCKGRMLAPSDSFDFCRSLRVTDGVVFDGCSFVLLNGDRFTQLKGSVVHRGDFVLIVSSGEKAMVTLLKNW